MRLTVFDLDHTLLAGDSDVLWCEYLMELGLLARAEFSQRNARMEAGYKAGTVDVSEFASFYASTLAGRSRAELEPVRADFLQSVVLPRIPAGARELVEEHTARDDLVVLSTATNRFITELTAAALGIPHLLAIELEEHETGFTGRTVGTLNMRAGKVARLVAWLAERGRKLHDFESMAYSDSINDLPLLEFVQSPVAVNPDVTLEAIARERRWPVLRLH